jgi:hypothetical protein
LSGARKTNVNATTAMRPRTEEETAFASTRFFINILFFFIAALAAYQRIFKPVML